MQLTRRARLADYLGLERNVIVAGLVGVVGTLVFAATVEARYAS